jgi:fido (protein-threonine AMPylation protein)
VRRRKKISCFRPFPNGNGRHSRICGDILVSHVLNRPIFTWGGKSIEEKGVTRKSYLDALNKADQGDLWPLVEFARSVSSTLKN